jgi:hypothetical protein
MGPWVIVCGFVYISASKHFFKVGPLTEKIEGFFSVILSLDLSSAGKFAKQNNLMHLQ